MENLPVFICESILLGVGLAMDAFSISMANGLQDPQMSRKRMGIIAGAFAWFQFLMPMIGWVCVHTISERFTAFQKAVPWIAFILLAGIGGKMLLEGIRGSGSEQSGQESREVTDRKVCPDAGPDRVPAEKKTPEAVRLTGAVLLLQAIATSIDALSVGFTIAMYSALEAFAASVLIAVTTFVICLGGIRIGRHFGLRLADRASILGGTILVLIGCRILFGGGF